MLPKRFSFVSNICKFTSAQSKSDLPIIYSGMNLLKKMSVKFLLLCTLCNFAVKKHISKLIVKILIIFNTLPKGIHHENNVPSCLSPQWHSGTWCMMFGFWLLVIYTFRLFSLKTFSTVHLSIFSAIKTHNDSTEDAKGLRQFTPAEAQIVTKKLTLINLETLNKIKSKTVLFAV